MSADAPPRPGKAWDELLAFWFLDAGPRRWFAKDAAFDQAIRDRFAGLQRQAAMGALAEWETAPEGALALVILLDQFPRNIFRDRREAFSCDALAREVADRALERGDDQALPLDRRAFFYLPFMHSEALADQERAIALYDALATAQGKPVDANSYARRHRDILRRFGRFPHRNAALGRASTPEETAFLRRPGSSF